MICVTLGQGSFLRSFFSWILIFLVCICDEANAADRYQRRALFETVKSRALETSSPAFVTAAVAELSVMPEGRNVASPVWEWSRLDGMEVAHLPFDDMEKLEELARNNESVLRESMKNDGKSPPDVEVHAMGASAASIAGQLSYGCAVNVNWAALSDPRITMSSGKRIPVTEACRLLAWVFAANGIQFLNSSNGSSSIMLRQVGK